MPAAKTGVTAPKDLTGLPFGLWTVLHLLLDRGPQGQRMWMCRCRCGLERAVQAGALVGGHSTGCPTCKNQETFARSRKVRRNQSRLTKPVHPRTCAYCGTDFLGIAKQRYCCIRHGNLFRKDNPQGD